MPKQENECPVCGYDFDEEGQFWICRHCGYYVDKRTHRYRMRFAKMSQKSYRKIYGIHNIRHFNPSSRDDLDIRPEI